MTYATRPTIAVLGAGHVGPAIARLALDAGHSVAIATSGNPGDLALVTQLLIPGAEPLWAVDAIARADIVVLAMPLHRFLRMDPNALSGKLVIDAMNYWPPSDGRLPPPSTTKASGPAKPSRGGCPMRPSSKRSTTSATTISRPMPDPPARWIGAP